MAKLFMVIGGIYGCLGVAFGAFGAHALKARLDTQLLDAYETGVRYQFYHALALLVVGLLLERWTTPATLPAAGWLFSGGVLLFSGSLYLLAIAGWRWLGPVTPLGGLLLIAGWVCFVIGVVRGG
ncbi:MAG: DUF423 domain-containing protein [Verrucomicrobia bacterium]|nr:DUF423 domain-containing protein [Verrucomicrobiota bacterium]MDA1086303.1 DUF423 domain-containing protein [Verrucomicrobiota bacterium]